MSKERDALKLALEALEVATTPLAKDRQEVLRARAAIRSALAEQPAQDNTYGYAKNLAEAMFQQHFASDEHYASGRVVWGVNDTVIGILTQIDNMVADMVRRPAQQQEPFGYFRYDLRLDAWVQNREGRPGTAFYTSPPASKPWVPLTDGEVVDLCDGRLTTWEQVRIARAIEAKLREKNK